MTVGTPRITIVGLGLGDPELLTQKSAQILRSGRVFLRSRIHPAIDAFPEFRDWQPFDHLVTSGESLESISASIVAELLRASAGGPIVYAVPGHPLIDDTVRLLLSTAAESNVSVRVIPSLSILDTVATSLGVDPLSSDVQLVDALDIVKAYEFQPYSGGLLPISPLRPAFIANVHSDGVASTVKLALLNVYPDDLLVTLLCATGTTDESASTIRLAELERQPIDQLSSLFVPAVDPYDFNRVGEGLQRIVARLRAPGGCPWDREQTHESLTRHMLEESYEVIDAIERGTPADLQEELGDVLLQVYLHAQIAEEAGDFCLEDVFETLSSKLVRRHPHVFGDRQISTSGDVVKAWDQIKQAERADKDEVPPSPFSSIPASLPALSRAQSVLRRAQSMGLAMSAGNELGDAGERLAQRLMEIVAEADTAGIDAEQALRRWTNSTIARSEQTIQTEKN
ncbi:MAG: MazG family protein [Nitrolancea sp.]